MLWSKFPQTEMARPKSPVPAACCWWRLPKRHAKISFSFIYTCTMTVHRLDREQNLIVECKLETDNTLWSGSPIWLFWSQILQFLLFLNTFGFFGNQGKTDKIWLFLAFFSQEGLALDKHCLSCIFITDLFWKECRTMQDAQNIEKILLLH